MFNRTLTLAIGGLCLAGLVACAPESQPQAQGDKTILLSRLSDGNLEYCAEDTDECQTLPYDGDCDIIEITIDTATGTSCQRCIMADGSVVDEGCNNAAVECVLITIPDPDCVVCAYVNGAVVYSSCTVDDDPECVVDADCNNDPATFGYCLEGECLYEPGCLDNSDCPSGFECMFYFMDGAEPNGDSADAPYWNEYGTCVPAQVPCETDAECPAGTYCQVSCWEYDCYPGDYDCGGCEGFCAPVNTDPTCDDVTCPPGTHCEMLDTPCAEPDPDMGAPVVCAGPIAECVPDYQCSSHEDCWTDNGMTGQCINGVCIFEDVNCDTRDAICEMIPPPCPDGMVISVVGSCYGACVDPAACAAMSCNSNQACPTGFACELIDCFGDESGGGFAPCFDDGICVPSSTAPTCDDIVCAAGEHCELQEVWCITEPCPPMPVCVPDQLECTSDLDCLDAAGVRGFCLGGLCVYEEGVDCNMMNALCDVIPPICPDGTVLSVVNGCYGECVDPHQCLPMYCGWDADCPSGFSCAIPDCYGEPTGSDCLVAGICIPDAPPPPAECFADSDCPADHICELTYCDPATGTYCGQGGICVPVPPPPPSECYADADCPAGLVCELLDCFDPTFDCGGGGVCVEPWQPEPECFPTGCSGQICADQDVYTTCEYLQVYACYADAACERQADGACGWTMTNELLVCIDQNS